MTLILFCGDDKKMERPEKADEITKAYKVGALLYSPANNGIIADSVINEKFDIPYSLALCLEDSISDSAVEQAEANAVETLKKIFEASKAKPFFKPYIFIRVRAANQAKKIFEKLGESSEMLTGFVFPKFSENVCEKYIHEMTEINNISYKTVYMMPIIESRDIVDLGTRFKALENIKKSIDSVKDIVLNVRVGGNDFCRDFGIRRHVDETIYDIRCVSNILSDVATCFAMDYVVSGPVWEYFDSFGWDSGMRRELKLDSINGFTGKTVIHPKQISIVNEFLKVSAEDYNDAKDILNMSENKEKLVAKSAFGSRMNEYKTHVLWAKKILTLSQIYGVKI
jgi:citrate lyase beta subunit